MSNYNFDYRATPLFPEDRAAIVSKEIFTIEDIGRLYQYTYDESRELINAIRFKCDRLHKKGKVHVLDYCQYFGMSISELRG